MAKTITVAKLIEKLQTILDEEGNLKVLFRTGEFEDEYGTIHPDASYEGDISIEGEQGILVINPNDRINSVDELLMNDKMHTKENGRRSYGALDDEYMREEEEDHTAEDDDEEEYLGFVDKDADDWEYSDDNE